MAKSKMVAEMPETLKKSASLPHKMKQTYLSAVSSMLINIIDSTNKEQLKQ